MISTVQNGQTIASQRLWGVVVARHGPAIGPAEDIAYTVRVELPQGFTTVGPVKPSHRRPSSFFDIEAAEVGDVCDVMYRNGGQMYFSICEGLAGQEACP